MNKGTIYRASKFLLAFSAIAAFAINTSFATTLIPVSDLDTNNYIDPLPPGGPGGGIQPLAGTDGSWIGNSAGTQLWSDTTKWSGGTVADGAGATANLTFNITTVAGRNVTIDGAVASRTIAILNIGDTDASSPY